jgi:hypothetical protein
VSTNGVKDAPERIPDGYLAVPISVDQTAAPLRVCALVRKQADPVAGHLVVLRSTVDARVFLGALVDAAGQVHQWVELWVQCLDGLKDTVTACRESLSNAILDNNWNRRFQTFCQIDPTTVVSTGWEAQHPLPVFLDVSRGEPVHPMHAETGNPWRLCQDDVLLKSKGLPAYATSLHRYLYLPTLGANSALIPVGADCPTNEFTKPLDSLTGGSADVAALNAGGGLLLVRAYSPVSYESFVDLLGGGKWEGVLHGRSMLDLGGPTAALRDDTTSPPAEGRLFLGAHGRWGRLVECFHLKLKLLADAVSVVRTLVLHQQRPLLNITSDSFRVAIGPPGSGLPFLWTARAVLVDPGDAVTLPIRTSDAQYYLRAGAAGTSVYHPVSVGLMVIGRGAVRIRQVLPDVGGATVLEGTFATHERIQVGKNDLIWLRLNLTSGWVDLYARLESETALAAGEWRFRTVGQRLSAAQTADLKAAEGVPIPDTQFEIVPLLSTPCDLYAMGVLAIRTLLMNEGTTLPVALDETLSLARQVATEYDPAVPLGMRIRAIFERDKRWTESLGPHRLTCETISSSEAFDLIPPEVWWETLAMIVRMLPGIGKDSLCRDFGDAPTGGIHRVFDPVRKDLDALLMRTRSLVVIDWRFNREIHSVVRGYLVGLTDKVAGGKKQA